MPHPNDSRGPRDLRDSLPEAPSAPPEALAFLWSRTSTVKEIWEVVNAVAGWPGVAITPHRGGLRLTLAGGAALGDLGWDGRLDLPFGTEMRDRLVAEQMVARDSDRPGRDRIFIDVRTLADVERAVWLLRLAYLSVDSPDDTRASDAARPPEPRATSR